MFGRNTFAMFFSRVSLALLALFSCSDAATPAQWRGRSIYQVFTDRFARTDGSTSASCTYAYAGYCGGTWRGLINKLDYIQGMGFTAIWISPVVQQVADQKRGYNGYSASNLYGLNNNFGTASDLWDLSQALHSRNMMLMVDVVANHMAYDGDVSSGVNYGYMHPFNDKSYYHNTCWVDNNNNNQTNIEECWLGDNSTPLPDLDTESPAVQNMFGTWIKGLVSNYSIDGLRVDTVKNVNKSFWSIFNSASGVYNVGEVADGVVEYVCPYQNYMDGVLTYPSYYLATTFFSNPSVTAANFVNGVRATINECKDSTLLGSFSENHDLARFANTTSDMTLAKNILTFTMLSDGIPIVYQGQEQHYTGGADNSREAIWLSGYPTNSPLYQLTKSLNAIRSLALSSSSSYLSWHTNIVYSDDHNVAFKKGDSNYATLMVVNNLGENAQSYSVQMNGVGFPSGLAVVDVLSCRTATVDGSGGLKVDFVSGLPMVYYPQYLLQNTGWCGH